MVPSRPSRASYYDPTARPPPPAGEPRQVLVFMRHGDRSPIAASFGRLDLSHLAPVWEALLPGPAERAALDAVPVLRRSDSRQSDFAVFAGLRPWGQLTSAGAAQCRAVGAELRRRYPRAKLRATSTCFQRTVDSAAAVVLGFAAEEQVPVNMRPPAEEDLLPNFDGACRRYGKLRRNRTVAVEAGPLRAALEDLRVALQPLQGGPAVRDLLMELKPLVVHAAEVGEVPGVDDALVHRCEAYVSALLGAVYEDKEILQLTSGRLLRRSLELLQQPGHEVHLMLGHDSTLIPLMVALGVYRSEWPLFASTVIIESADFGGQRRLRVLVDDEVRRDWEAHEDFVESLQALTITEAQYSAVCSSDASQL